MPNRAFTLSIKGELSLADSAAAFMNFSKLLSAISDEAVPEHDVTWRPDDLAVGSMEMTARAESDSAGVLDEIDVQYLSVGRSIASPNGHRFAPPIAHAAGGLAALVPDRARAMRFETPSGRATVGDASQWPQEDPHVAPTTSLGSVEGFVQTVTSRGGMRFTVFDSLNDRAVRCFLSDGDEELMRGVWGKRAVIDGSVTRDGATGRPLTIRDITRATVIEPPPPGSYRNARGVLVRAGSTPRAETIIRRLRDAE